MRVRRLHTRQASAPDTLHTLCLMHGPFPLWARARARARTAVLAAEQGLVRSVWVGLAGGGAHSMLSSVFDVMATVEIEQ